MKARLGGSRVRVQRPSRAEESQGLRPMAVAADRLEVRVLEVRSAGGDLDDMVHVELARASSPVAQLARVVIPKHHVGTGGVPEVVPMEFP